MAVCERSRRCTRAKRVGNWAPDVRNGRLSADGELTKRVKVKIGHLGGL